MRTLLRLCCVGVGLGIDNLNGMGADSVHALLEKNNVVIVIVVLGRKLNSRRCCCCIVAAIGVLRW